MYNRKSYTDQIYRWKDKPLVKIISGLRRSGKSTLLKLYMDSLVKTGISPERIIYVNKESLRYDHIKTYKELYQEINGRYKKIKKKLYLFVDEVQEIEQWEKAVVSFHSDNIADIYLTGSNARIFSGELATLLGGRYVQIPIYPLTYSEFLLFRESPHEERLFDEFLEFGGMPGLHHLKRERAVLYEYLRAIFDTIVLRDIIQRNSIRNPAFLEKIIQFVFSNIAQIFSAKRIADFLKKEQRRVNVETVYNYLKYLEDAHVIYRVPRYDLKGKRLLEVREKYFAVDIGLRHALLGYNKQTIGQLLENIVYIELKKRGYTVFIAQLENAEVDFIVERNNQKAYIQVAYLLPNENTVEREFGILLKIKDNYPKYVLSLDRHFPDELNGIKHLNLVDFLLKEELNL